MLEDQILEALKEACARAGSQVELAKSTGLSQGQISDYLCGRRRIKNMTVGTIEKIFPALTVQFFQNDRIISSNQTEKDILLDLQRRVIDLEKAQNMKREIREDFSRRSNGAVFSIK